ncbi:monovalent cation:proton antiporter-2 (CPA2) family protein [Taibaiella koreensis]|uniref:monovalent cation:proton antiporter-2 (CPA2) family protein n=1 Tax=Taibaiella koreensis TaxID=1268548 RepID=UPI000E59C3A0|nr:monovalent cation:proton antiporter-2 (CPA2) family protein [Taibaiella koreensis]
MDHSFFVQALIYLGSAVLLVPLSKKLGLGSVLGYLLAGILIGPSVLGWIGNDGADIMHFAEFGVVMMLFLIGLEVEPQLLWRWRTAILGLGGLQVLITALIIGFIAHIIVGLSFNQSLSIGLIFAMSSTAIVLQTMTENNWMQTIAGRNAFSVLLFQDIAVIPILALLPLLSPDDITASATQSHVTITQNLEPWARTLVVLGAVAAIIIGGKYLTRPIFQMVAATNLRELFSATALLLVVAITVLMSLVGLSPALGAFLAGVVLANSEYRHELESDIEPFKGLLLGLFFIAVGASIDFGLIAQRPGLIAILVLGVMLIKLGILAFLSRMFRMRVDQFLLFAFALAQVGEFAFVLFSFAKDQHIFSTELFNLLMVVVAASMALSPVFMLVMEKVLMPLVVKKIPHRNGPEADAFEENNPVIIAGYGRFGSVTGRFLKANGINTTVLDANSDRVESLRKIGIKVYYGDALRIDLLKSAGADRARLIIIALDDSAQVLQLVNTVKKHFPNLHIIARAHGLDDTYELMDAGVLHVFRETIDTSLRAGTEALKIMGVRAYTAQRAYDLFLQHDEKSLKKMAAARHDKKKYINAMRSRIEELETLIQNDIHERAIHTHTGKDMSEVRKEDEETVEEED